MSTRSGKRIHISFHEKTEKSEGLITSVPKTKSKHSKENLDIVNVSPKLKKRNYVAYPSEDDSGVDAADGRGETGNGKTTRVLRKDVLKERNVRTSTESIEPAVDARKSLRSTRKTRKFAEDAPEAPQNEEPSKVELKERNVRTSTESIEPAIDARKSLRSTRKTRKFAEDAPEAPQNVEPSKVELPKPKKEKKKKKKAEQEQVKEVEEIVPKKKSKKKKGRRSGSMIVEDIVPESNNLNKSNMSVDSFYSAAGSPRNTDNEPASQDLEQAVDAITSTLENNSSKTESRKTRSAVKLDNTLTNDIITKEEPRKKKMSVKMNCESSLNEANDENEKDAPNRQLKKHKTSIKNTVYIADNINIDGTNEKLLSAEKSIINVIDKTITPNKVNIIEDVLLTSAKGKKRKSIMNDNDVKKDLKADDLLNTTFEKEVSESAHKGKKRKSAINASIKIAEKNSPSPANSRKSANETIDNNLESNENKCIKDLTFDNNENSSTLKSSSNLFEEETQQINTTYEKDSADFDPIKGQKKSIVDATFDLTSSPFKSANEVSSPPESIDKMNRKSVINTTFEKDSNTDQVNKKNVNTTFDKDATETIINTTFDKVEDDIKEKRKTLQRSSAIKINSVDSTFDKNSKSSLISSDNSMITLDKSEESRISITSNESKENILNTTLLLIESSLDESQLNTTLVTKTHSETIPEPTTPLKREGTFTKDEPVVSSPKPRLSVSKTPTKCSLPSPGFTPFHVNKSSMKEKSVLLNVTKSIEKRRSSLVEPPRTTKVMFCSPVDNPALLMQNRKKVIKSNLKGSNKSFVFDDSVSLDTRPSNRKRSYTHNDADERRVKRKRLADELQQSVDRLSRPRTSSASAKLAEPTTPAKIPTTPSKKSDAKKSMSRTKLPNFAAMHQKQFDKMESLDECQERKAKRAKQLLTPNGATNMLERISPKDKAENPEPEKPKEAPKKPETPIKSLPTFKSLNPGYTRFGFKLNLDVNPFSIPSKTQRKPKENKPNLNKPILPSLTGATSVRREVAKQTVMREKSFADRGVKRTENRHVIKGVRTNRRFELQMRMRDI